MRVMLAVIAVLATRLAFAPGATAQSTYPDPSDTDDDPPRPTLPRRLEIGGTMSAVMGFPEFGLIASIPIVPILAIEVVGARMGSPHSDAPAHELGQVQLRVPFHRRLRSRRSLVLGWTGISAIPRHQRFIGIGAGSFTGPHAGASLQWRLAPMLDFRFDAQAIFTFARDLPTVERLTTAIVWHPPARSIARAGGRP